MADPAYLGGLNPEQRQAVLHGSAPLLVLAGAGSGKTRVITTRIAHLLEENKFRPDQILAVTFTNKAAREMVDRVKGLHPGGQDVLIKTFHSFCAWLLRRNAEVAGLSPHFNIYDDDDSYALLKASLPRIPPAEVKILHRGIIKSKDIGLDPDHLPEEFCPHPDFREVWALYEKKLAETGNLDFPGLIGKTVTALEENRGLRTRIQQKFPCLLVDEFQDTNRLQYRLLSLLSGKDTWLTVVGDDDQSIYRFRGAEVQNILSFPQGFPGTEIIRLEENYRSSGHILGVASAVVAKNSGRLGKTLWTRQSDGKKPEIYYFDSMEEEAQLVVRLVKEDPKMETAVLYRTNAQSRTFETLLNKERIPYRIVGSTRFYDREEIKDVLGYLFLLANPKDEVAFRRIINKPARGVGPSALESLLETPGETLLDRCRGARLKGKAKTGVEAFLKLMDDASRLLPSEGLQETIKYLTETSGLLEFHRSQDEVLGSGKVENLGELLTAAAGFSPGAEGLVEFLERVELEGGEASQEGDEKASVILITMHNTKGLEFDRVVITGLEEGLFPRDDEDQKEVEEERRLFYVAITRARKSLYFTTCRRRMLHGRFLDQYPSRFLEDIPADRSEAKGKKVQKAPDYTRGMTVYHDDYGTGQVVSTWYNGPEFVVKVQFESGRSGIFLPAYTPLEKVGSYDW